MNFIRWAGGALASLLMAVVLLPHLSACKPVERVTSAQWTLSYADGVSISCGGKPLLRNVVAEYRLGNRLVSTSDYKYRRFVRSKLSDLFGRGDEWIITYEDEQLPQLVQSFRIYDRFILTDISVVASRRPANQYGDTLSLNYMAPVVANGIPVAPSGKRLRRLIVPFDNDAWIRYRTTTQTSEPSRSYEVAALYDVQSREGLVVGAISHDHWKNAIDFGKEGRELCVFSGVADSLTRDVHAHGYVRGQQVRSSTMFIGLFDDWREGLETFADANATMAPPRPWTKAMPVGWNSWGALAFRVNHDNATQVVRFLADSLQAHSFCNAEGLVYTGLDSGWNNFTEAELKDFADECRRHHQVPCIYWTPFTDWGKNPQESVKLKANSEKFSVDADPALFTLHSSLKFKDIYLYANGKPQELDGAYALDPTHPAVQAMMEQTADLFRRCGYEYVKMDFMTHGRMEADGWYRKDITTGTEAYNYGMHLLDSIFADFYLNLSISPIFPAQYAQSRRIACDAWNKMKDTEYTMNALSWGWWIDRIYQFNDADHVVLRDASEGENRARITSSVITGLYITGDDFSRDGDQTAKARACQLLTNAEINRLATGRSFRPLAGDSDEAEHCFVRQEANGNYVLAVFNYGEDPLSMTLPLAQMGIADGGRCMVTELWTHQTVASQDRVVVPAKDARVYRVSVK